MFVVMLTELEVYLDEGDGDVCDMLMELEASLGEGDGDVGDDDDDGVGSIPW